MTIGQVVDLEQQFSSIDSEGNCWSNRTNNTVLFSGPLPPTPRNVIINRDQLNPGLLAGAVAIAWEKNHQAKAEFTWKGFLSDDILVSGIGNLWLEDKLIVDDRLLPNFWKGVIMRKEFSDTFDIEREASLPSREVDFCMPFTCWGFRTYGHVLIDALPRLLIAREYFKDERLRVAFRDDTPRWALDMCSAAGVPEEDFIFFDPKLERLRIRRGVYPQFPRHSTHGFHPIVKDLFLRTELGKPVTKRTGKYFLSRAKLPEWRRRERCCLNESTVEEVAMKEFGYIVIHPEHMSWREQINLFCSAEVVSGFSGSGLHTSIFSDGSLKIGMIGLNAIAQLEISSLTGQRIALLTEGIPPEGQFTVKLPLLREMLSQLD